ncbi:hypothetical protein [Jannaschia rubra]|uniref:hypothetical protein n=1 Tax=Jannaschia rubra TaxID=282197 RepID=UPI0006E1EA63|nr:hypothetical protein [Jannaschia rubra]
MPLPRSGEAPPRSGREVETIAIDEDALDISEEDLIESHRMLIAHALGRPVSAVKIKVKPEAA